MKISLFILLVVFSGLVIAEKNATAIPESHWQEMKAMHDADHMQKMRSIMGERHVDAMEKILADETLFKQHFENMRDHFFPENTTQNQENIPSK